MRNSCTPPKQKKCFRSFVLSEIDYRTFDPNFPLFSAK